MIRQKPGKLSVSNDGENEFPFRISLDHVMLYLLTARELQGFFCQRTSQKFILKCYRTYEILRLPFFFSLCPPLSLTLMSTIKENLISLALSAVVTIKNLHSFVTLHARAHTRTHTAQRFCILKYWDFTLALNYRYFWKFHVSLQSRNQKRNLHVFSSLTLRSEKYKTHIEYVHWCFI